jgi:hypothetical protein
LSKKIVIIPTFCESHLIKYQIPNIIDTIDPDYIIYNEGMFPNGTEGNKTITQKWKDEYTLNGEGMRGFDYLELKKIIKDSQKKYVNTKIILNEMEYLMGMSSTDCYVAATTNFKDFGIDIKEGDYIFPYEGDVFHHEDSKKEIQNYMDQLEPGQGFRSIWIDYMQNFWYVEMSRIKPYLADKKHHHPGNHMSRRICVRYKDGSFYREMLENFMTTNYIDPSEGYGMLHPTDLITYHYAWIRPGKFKQFRCDQLERWPGYWDVFKHGLDKVNEYKYNEVLVRPDLQHLTKGYIKFFDKFPHPKHIKEHEDWTEMTDDDRSKLRKCSDVYAPKEIKYIYQPFANAETKIIDLNTINRDRVVEVLESLK